MGLATAGTLIGVAACGGDDSPSTESSDGPVSADGAEIPVEPFPETLPDAFIFRGEEIEAAAEAEQEEVLYVVQAGDTLALIAERFDITAEEIQRINGIADPSILSVGDELRIPVPAVDRIAAVQDGDGEAAEAALPPGEPYTVQSGDTLFDIGTAFGVPWQTIAAHNQLTDFEAANLTTGRVIIIPPQEEEAAEESDEPTEPPG